MWVARAVLRPLQVPASDTMLLGTASGWFVGASMSTGLGAAHNWAQWDPLSSSCGPMQVAYPLWALTFPSD